MVRKRFLRLFGEEKEEHSNALGTDDPHSEQKIKAKKIGTRALLGLGIIAVGTYIGIQAPVWLKNLETQEERKSIEQQFGVKIEYTDADSQFRISLEGITLDTTDQIGQSIEREIIQYLYPPRTTFVTFTEETNKSLELEQRLAIRRFVPFHSTLHEGASYYEVPIGDQIYTRDSPSSVELGKELYDIIHHTPSDIHPYFRNNNFLPEGWARMLESIRQYKPLMTFWATTFGFNHNESESIRNGNYGPDALATMMLMESKGKIVQGSVERDGRVVSRDFGIVQTNDKAAAALMTHMTDPDERIFNPFFTAPQHLWAHPHRIHSDDTTDLISSVSFLEGYIEEMRRFRNGIQGEEDVPSTDFFEALSDPSLNIAIGMGHIFSGKFEKSHWDYFKLQKSKHAKQRSLTSEKFALQTLDMIVDDVQEALQHSPSRDTRGQLERLNFQHADFVSLYAFYVGGPYGRHNLNTAAADQLRQIAQDDATSSSLKNFLNARLKTPEYKTLLDTYDRKKNASRSENGKNVYAWWGNYMKSIAWKADGYRQLGVWLQKQDFGEYSDPYQIAFQRLSAIRASLENETPSSQSIKAHDKDLIIALHTMQGHFNAVEGVSLPEFDPTLVQLANPFEPHKPIPAVAEAQGTRPLVRSGNSVDDLLNYQDPQKEFRIGREYITLNVSEPGAELLAPSNGIVADASLENLFEPSDYGGITGIEIQLRYLLQEHENPLVIVSNTNPDTRLLYIVSGIKDPNVAPGDTVHQEDTAIASVAGDAPIRMAILYGEKTDQGTFSYTLVDPTKTYAIEQRIKNGNGTQTGSLFSRRSKAS